MKKARLLSAFIVLVIVAIACGSSSDPAEKVDPVAATIAALDAQTQVSAVKVESTPEPTAPVLFNVGDTVLLDKIQLTLINAQGVPPTEIWKPKDGNRFFKIEFSFENKDDRDRSVSSGDFKLLGADGTQYSYSSEPILAAGGESLYERLMSGAKINGMTGFEVPADQTAFTLVFSPSFSFTNETAKFEVILQP